MPYAKVYVTNKISASLACKYYVSSAKITGLIHRHCGNVPFIVGLASVWIAFIFLAELFSGCSRLVGCLFSGI